MQLKSEIKGFIVQNFLYGQRDNDFNDDASFLGKGIIDSTGVLELVSFVEGAFGILVADDELVPDNFDSINKLSAFIVKKRKDSKQLCSGTH
ncbi:MAG: acyl carrier protein [Nitrospirae bacterium]|nr:acyl carrier protein [Nitrospirota bacterium]MCL5237696.1 acyl carrier protein [Nitrospirota bacterium]